MEIGFKADNKLDANNKPAGGYVCGTGFTISWQDGPLGRVGTDERIEPNGAFVEDVIAAAIQRIEHYDKAGFGCVENGMALSNLKEALAWLASRTKRRTDQGVEGTHEGS